MHSIVNKISQGPGLPVPRPTSSFWQEPQHDTLAEIQSPKLPATADALVIGSDITATSTAQTLLTSNPFVSVVVAEARTIASGATGCNGGHVLELPFEEYEMELAMLGREEAKKLMRFRLGHLREMIAFTEKHFRSSTAEDMAIYWLTLTS